jgi:hypothetical protein
VDAEIANALPRRRSSRARPQGRHRSPDRLSVPSAAPVLVLAVPAAQCAASAEIAAAVNAGAGTLCPGAAIRAGYTGDGPKGLATLLGSVVDGREAARADEVADDCPYAAVVVPLAITPDPDHDACIADAAGQAGPAVTVTPHLGPHPLLAAALHDRLAEAGLAHARRISGLSLVSTAVGVLVAAAGGEDALRAAATCAILLTSRLGVPVAPVSLGRGDSLASAKATLREAGASRLVMAPYVLGTEISPQALAAEAAAAGAECAPAIGGHPALGQLATMRYGAALLQRPPGPASPALPRRDDLGA